MPLTNKKKFREGRMQNKDRVMKLWTGSDELRHYCERKEITSPLTLNGPVVAEYELMSATILQLIAQCS